MTNEPKILPSLASQNSRVLKQPVYYNISTDEMLPVTQELVNAWQSQSLVLHFANRLSVMLNELANDIIKDDALCQTIVSPRQLAARLQEAAQKRWP